MSTNACERRHPIPGADRTGGAARGHSGCSAASSLASLLVSILIAWAAPAALLAPFQAAASGDQATKRVESRSTEGDSTARPAGAKPSSTGPARNESKPECETVQKVVVEEKTTVEEIQIIKVEETVTLRETQSSGALPDVLTFEEVLQNTLGRPKVTSVIASTERRSLFPGFAFVGIRPPISLHTVNDTLRLQRFECELEAGTDWNPAHSLFTLAVGHHVLQFTPPTSESPTAVLVTDAAGGRTFPMTISLRKRLGPPRVDRYLLSIAFVHATLGQAPRIFADDGIFIAADPAPGTASDDGSLRFILVERSEAADSTLSIVEKSGSTVPIPTALSSLDLASFCSVVHLVQ